MALAARPTQVINMHVTSVLFETVMSASLNCIVHSTRSKNLGFTRCNVGRAAPTTGLAYKSCCGKSEAQIGACRRLWADHSDVTRLGSSSRAPLLAPGPLRTGLEGFPFIRLEHPKTPP